MLYLLHIMIKKLVLITSLLLCFAYATNAQNWIWAQKLGNIKSDKITSIKTDGLGYIYIAGYFSTSTPIGINGIMLNFTANSHSKEAFIAKLDSTGYCYWAQSGGAYYDDRILGMDVDSAGNSTITGTFWEGSGINFGTTNISGSAYGWGDQCFVVRFDPNGNILWGSFVCSNSSDDQGLDVPRKGHAEDQLWTLHDGLWVGSGLAGVAGVAVTLLGSVGPNMGGNYIVDCFID
jgi:hypothetical protein